ncbi:MAG: hypothetical protein PHU21_10900 [Elusimicrobia bacterium]|jgi:hypothetical protein|nr:hypothetical protein [Elusimicrobiota bacterium]
MWTRNSLLLWAALSCAAPARAQETGPAGGREPKADHVHYLAPSHLFSCEAPRGWQAFETEDALGPVVRLLGPDNPAGTYRAGLSVRWVEKGGPGYVEAKQAVEEMRRSDKDTKRSATAVTPMRVEGLLARLFEVVETRVLPLERLPAAEAQIHHYVAVIPSGRNYYLVRLSSARDVYLDFREDYLRCLKTFKPLAR